MSKMDNFEQDYSAKFDYGKFKKIFRFAMPHKKYFIYALFFVLIITGVDLVLPLISKKAIDDYIVATHRRAALNKDVRADEILLKATGSEMFFDGFVMLSEPALDDMSKDESIYLRNNDILEDERYLLLAKNKDPDGLVEGKYSQIVEDDNKDYYIIKYTNLKEVDIEDLRMLRMDALDGIMFLGLLIFGLLVLRFFTEYAQIYIMNLGSQNTLYAIRAGIFEKLQKLPLAFFDRHPVGKIVTRASNDVEALNQMFTDVLLNSVKDFFILIGIIVVLLFINAKLALVTFISIPIIVFTSIYFGKKLRENYRVLRSRLSIINATVQENLSGMKIVHLFNRQLRNYKKFKKTNGEYLSASIREIKLNSFFRPVIDVVATMTIGLVIWYGGGQVIETTITIGTLIAFLGYVDKFFRPITEISMKYNILQSAIASTERIINLLETDLEIEEKDNPAAIGDVKGEIRFEDVSFAYDNENYVLKNIDFTVKPGESIALVGATGSGKTSIISLLLRFYDIQKGKILIDGTDVRDMMQKELRRNICVVLQDVFLFSGRVIDNIRLSNKDISQEEIDRIARYVNVDRFISKLDGGYDSEVTERGSTFSSGEKQLLAFARLLAYDPAIVVLDEATSSVDSETEALIQDAIDKVIKDRTTIIVAHRLSTIKKVDKILVLYKGRIVEAGTHNELMKNKKYYYNLYLLQYNNKT